MVTMDDKIKMARDIGEIIRDVILAERERCAQICDKEAAAMQRVADFHRPPRVDYDPALADMHEQGAAVASRLADAIRQDNPQ
jgi:hypothetical protein